MPRGLTRWRWRRPFPWGWLLVSAVAALLFAGLGAWQWGRGQGREAAWAASEREAVTDVRGVLLADRQILLDNITRDGRAGYEVLTPLVDADNRLWLINRGWIPFSGYRDRLPEISLPPEHVGATVSLRGRRAALPVAGIASPVPSAPAVAATWPRVLSFPQWPELEAALGRPTDRLMLHLAQDSGPGYERNWPRTGVPPERHFAYAIQWWSFAALALALFVLLNLRKPDERSSEQH
ncbi:MAG: hypothetical protein RL026_1542 [Pseudomonadota bacterium]|jgi:surfeit locus 1 family protein